MADLSSVESIINPGNAVQTTEVSNTASVYTTMTSGNQVITTHNTVPQVQTVIVSENREPITTIIYGDWDVVWSVNGQTGDVLIDVVLGDFTPATTYTKNAVISYNGKLYKAKNTFTSGQTFNASDWDELSVVGSSAAGEFVANHPYIKNEMVYYSGSLYLAKNNFTSGATFDPNDWNIGGGVFIAEYGVTQYTDILSALNSGLAVFCRKDTTVGSLNQSVYVPITRYNSNGVIFFGGVLAFGVYTSFKVNINNVWTTPVDSDNFLVTAAQSLTSQQKTQVQTNIGLGSLATKSTITTSDITDNSVTGEKIYSASLLKKLNTQNGSIFVPANANLNTTTYLNPGRYYCGYSDVAQTIQNNPCGDAFYMDTVNLLSTATTPGPWTYFVRTLYGLNGSTYTQYCYLNGEGVASYSGWNKIPSVVNSISSTDTVNALSAAQGKVLNDSLQNIVGKIPTQASSSNQLADKNFVNSSINSVTAYYITKDAAGNPFATKAELTSATTFYSGGEVRVPTRNDYCVVLADESKTDPVTSENPTTRYIYQGNQWEYQYTVNKTTLTAAQLAAVNSNITAELTTKLQGIEAGAQVNVQPDWNQATTTADDYIKNKPALGNLAYSNTVDTAKIDDSAVTIPKLASGLASDYRRTYSWRGFAGGEWTGWIKITKINVGSGNYFTSKNIHLSVTRTWTWRSPELYDLNLSVAYNAASRWTVMNKSWSVQLIEQFRLVMDETNHWAYIEMYVNPNSGSDINNVYFVMDVIASTFTGDDAFITMFEKQTEQESALAFKSGVDVTGSGIIKTADISDGAVTTDKIDDGAVTGSKINAKYIQLANSSATDTGVTIRRNDTNTEMFVGVSAADGINHGVWSSKLGRWLVNGDASNCYLQGQAIASRGGSWYQGRDVATAKNNRTAIGDVWAPVVSSKSKDGDWSIGCNKSGNELIFDYTSDTNYSSGSGATELIRFYTDRTHNLRAGITTSGGWTKIYIASNLRLWFKVYTESKTFSANSWGRLTDVAGPSGLTSNKIGWCTAQCTDAAITTAGQYQTSNNQFHCSWTNQYGGSVTNSVRRCLFVLDWD